MNRSKAHRSSHMKPPILQHEQIIPPIKNNGGDTLGSRREHVHGKACRASPTIRGDGGVHGEGLNGDGELGAKPSLPGVQECDRREASLVAHHLLDRVEGGEPRQ